MSDLYWLAAMFYMGLFLGLARDDKITLKEYGLMFVMAMFWPATLVWCAWHQWRDRRHG